MSTSTEPATNASATEELSGLVVLHLFSHLPASTDRAAIELAIKEAQSKGDQVVTVSMLGHKADLGILALSESPQRLRELQSAVVRAGAVLTYSYLSLTEISEYSGGVPEAMRLARIRPSLPPEGLTAFCFYPMSKRRGEEDNWFRLPYDDRKRLMMEHGVSGRTFAGRITQLITGSTGLDEYEWGVTLFGRNLQDLKECVYQMRFDEASARYADFGDFLTGVVASPHEVFEMMGWN